MPSRKSASAQPESPNMGATGDKAAADAVSATRHRAKRKNIPPAGLAAQGRV